MALYYEEPIALERGEGRTVWDAEGNTYLDFFGGILTTMTSHAQPEVVAAVQEQAAKIMHSSTLYLIEDQIALAEEVAELSGIPDAKVFLTTSGTEANELALLLACTARRSNQVLAMRNSYHGRSFATMGITGNRGWSASSLTPVNVHYVHGGYRYRSPFRELDDDAYIAACVDDLRDVLATQTAGDVACLVAEPIQGVGGFTHPPDGLYGALAEVCREHGILLVSDEVQTGWGRTGDRFWGYEHHGYTPDVLTFAKGIGNGLSMGGVVARAELMDSVTANSISTFGGNPLTCAGARANLRVLRRDDLPGNARKQGELLAQRLHEAVEPLACVGDVRGKGLMLGVELVRPGTGDPGEPAPELTSKVLEATKGRGLLIGKGGLHGNVLRITPPLSVTAEETERGAAALADALAEAGASA
ncbi:aspartate aminotransferase family protein [Egibacter rhizosphaerae]|uniref:alanine--glyoxylate transaminase n=2 Tax=Egibacter rhizosphaerae TaxID=1670831 RepID=A0A411YL86_9ACTN|nr:aspartate aminotransferase family protein [Egibacter rhizosphaerae]